MCLYTNPRGQKSKELSKRAFQQVRTYGSLRFKGIVSDHGSTALAVTYIGYGFKNPTNLGFHEYNEHVFNIIRHFFECLTCMLEMFGDLGTIQE